MKLRHLYSYDTLNQLSSIVYRQGSDPDPNTPDVAFTYSRLGQQLSAITTGVATNLYSYDPATLELITETQNGVIINRSRDIFGRESGIALEADYDVNYAYDTFGRFSAVTSDSLLATNNFSYSYLAGSPIISGMTASAGHAWTRSYEPNRNLITSITNSFNGNLISAFDYANDEIGRRTARLDSQLAGVAITNAFGYNTRSEVKKCCLKGMNQPGITEQAYLEFRFCAEGSLARRKFDYKCSDSNTDPKLPPLRDFY